MSQCFLCLCNKKQPKRQANISFHKFPTNVKVRQAWLDVCGLSPEDDVSKTKICSLHFLSSDYKEVNAKTLGGRMVLKPWAVPFNSMSVIQPTLQQPEACVSHKTPTASENIEEMEVVASSSAITIPDTADVQTDSEDIVRTPKKRKFFEP
ncbi:hypothetical protein ABEB36_015059 [Hypothenemus hampei]|uniref:THAP-type domain-containing protein n=1 Tax=Hypothenemus hampei TaxID=57062 RepID=A0ABD1E178_HYPHA